MYRVENYSIHLCIKFKVLLKRPPKYQKPPNGDLYEKICLPYIFSILTKYILNFSKVQTPTIQIPIL